MKKILATVLCFSALGGLSAYAAPLAGCEYTENMFVQGPVGSRVLSLEASTIVAVKVSDTYFKIIGTCGKSDGLVNVKVGMDDSHYVTLTIRDGQYMWNPEIINISPVGNYNYSGIDHSLGTYDYTLKFSN